MVSKPLKGLGREEWILEIGESIGERAMVNNVKLVRYFTKQEENNILLEEVVEEMKKNIELLKLKAR